MKDAITKPIRVMIVDDHAVVRSGLSAFLLVYDDLELVAEANSGAEAVRLCEETQPDVVLMDMVMPGMDGAQATQIIKKSYPQVQVIALTSFKEDELVHGALEAGAIGYLLKNISVDELARAIRAAHVGRPTLAPEATEALIHTSTQSTSQHLGHDLTTREKEVLELMVKGLNNSDIAKQLVVSRSTVRFHVSNVLSKLQATSRTEAVAVALKQKLVK
jgi:NarL family two-component system response regulator LiaR